MGYSMKFYEKKELNDEALYYPSYSKGLAGPVTFFQNAKRNRLRYLSKALKDKNFKKALLSV